MPEGIVNAFWISQWMAPTTTLNRRGWLWSIIRIEWQTSHDMPELSLKAPTWAEPNSWCRCCQYLHDIIREKHIQQVKHQKEIQLTATVVDFVDSTLEADGKRKKWRNSYIDQGKGGTLAWGALCSLYQIKMKMKSSLRVWGWQSAPLCDPGLQITLL